MRMVHANHLHAVKLKYFVRVEIKFLDYVSGSHSLNTKADLKEDLSESEHHHFSNKSESSHSSPKSASESSQSICPIRLNIEQQFWIIC